MTTPRKTWTDPRLDDLSKKVDDGFAAADKKMDAGFAKMETTFGEVRAEMKAGFEIVNTDIREVRSFMNRLLVALLAIGGGIVAALLGLIGTLVGTHAF